MPPFPEKRNLTRAHFLRQSCTVAGALAFWGSGIPSLWAQGNGKDLHPVVPSAGPLAGDTPYVNSHALIVGISKYRYLPADKQLQYAHKDAQALRDVLIRSYGFPAANVTLLVNDQATKTNIEQQLAALTRRSRVGSEDRILVYFSGHGQTVELQTGGEMGFLIPYDGEVDLASLAKGEKPDPADYLATCLPMNRLWDYFSASAAKHALLIADACYGGLIVRAKGLSGRLPEKLGSSSLRKLLSRPARQVITAGSAGEKAYESPQHGYGTFTFKLLEELKARAANPGDVFTATELYSYLQTSVGNISNGRQTPQLGNYGGTEGEFLFITTRPNNVPSTIASSPTTAPVSSGSTGNTGGSRPEPSAAARLTYLGQIRQELDSARSSFSPDPSRDLCSLVVAMTRAGSFETAKSLLQSSLQITNGMGNAHQKAFSYCLVAVAQAQVGDIAGAKRTIGNVGEEYGKTSPFKATALADIAVAQARSGDTSGAKQTIKDARQSASSISDQNVRAIALETLAVSQARLGDFEAAKRSTHDIRNGPWKASAISGVAQVQVRQRDLNGAKKTIFTIDDSAQRVIALSNLAVTQAKLGDFDKAGQTFQEAKQIAYLMPKNDNARRSLAVTQNLIPALKRIKSGDSAGALNLVETLESDRSEDKDTLLSAVAIGLAQAGNLDGALATVRRMNSVLQRVETLGKMAQVMNGWVPE
jgi:tetratricopeptide (TPR) repeat protein